MIKIGAIVGDLANIGCHTILNPGSVICKNTILYPQLNFRGYIGPNKICKLIQEQVIVDKK